MEKEHRARTDWTHARFRGLRGRCHGHRKKWRFGGIFVNAREASDTRRDVDEVKKLSAITPRLIALRIRTNVYNN